LDDCDAGKSAVTAAEGANLHIAAYPNPFSGSTTVRFQVNETAATHVNVYNMTGAKVASLFEGIADGGQVYEVVFDGTELPAGTYLYRLVAGSEQRVGRLMIAR
jgi:serine protease AprX